jgi:hypothetical protein
MHKPVQPYGSDPSRSKLPLVILGVLFAVWFVFLASTAWQRAAQG